MPARTAILSSKWGVLALSALTATFTVAAPSMGLSVLFKEIATDLNLDLVQVGLVWSIGSLPAILTSLLGGALIDRLGPKKVTLAALLLLGLVGAARGLAVEFGSLLLTILILGSITPLVTMSAYKLNGMWFPAQQLGLANGVFSMGMALGFMLGAFFSATLLSPMLGGWRSTMFFYGALAVLFCLPWAFAAPQPPQPAGSVPQPPVPLRQAFGRILRIRSMWLVGIAMLGYSGGIQGLLGYLPLYLRGQGWEAFSADGAQTLFHAMSLVFVIPITFLSDRLRVRRGVLLATLALTVAGAGLLIFSSGWPVWLAVVVIGLGRDATMALLYTMSIQMKGVGIAFAGSAAGLMNFFSGIGTLLASPLGNSLAGASPGAPFAFWTGMAALALLSLALVRSGRAGPAEQT